ncbi:MAG TPA: FAD-dependent oxidoreductase [Chitinophagaceae bacterium]|nr:FAD-dependent oxidoreductase [Chitinophagaceae bacterium]
MNKQTQFDARVTSGENLSYWVDSEEPLRFSRLEEDIETDVLVIGGGISGLSVAYNLLKKGKQVVVLEDGFIGSGESGRTTAHLTAALDDRYYHIEKIVGEEGMRLAAESHSEAVNWIETVVSEQDIDCNFRRVNGYLFLHPSDKLKSLEKEFEATQRAGLSTRWVDEMPGIAGAPGPAICYPQQGQFHIMKYLKGLARAIEQLGGRIFTESRANNIEEDGAECNGRRIHAQFVVVATNSPENNRVTMHTKQFPFRTYVIGAKIPKGSLPAGLWWDTGDMDAKWYTAPYHYVRTEDYDDQYDLLISGGEDHKTGQADAENIPEEQRFDALIHWTKDHFPMMQDVSYRWSGQVLEPLDYLAFIGKNPGSKNIYIATGDSGNGMTHGTIAGILISDLIIGVENPWEKIYSPKRSPLKVPARYLKEMAAMAAQYGDYIARGDIRGVDELHAGEGAIMSRGLKRYAVYRDEHNELHVFSAVCPHLGCVLQWNGEEKSFDCPCHGSRFTCMGEVVNGPAATNLKQIQVEEESLH